MTLSASDHLHQKRSQLKMAGHYAEAMPIQRQIIRVAERSGNVRHIANGWNVLSHLQELNGQFRDAEQSALKALDVYNGETKPCSETRATYEMKLAIILAHQRRLKDAVRHGQKALANFAEFHDPPDDFLTGMTRRVAQWAELHKLK